MSNNCKEQTKTVQLGYCAIGAIVFFILSLPVVYSLTNRAFGGGGELHKSVLVNLDPSNGDVLSPTYLGLLVHAVVYMFILFFIMQPWKKPKWSCDEKC
jgi:hypothetical protein